MKSGESRYDDEYADHARKELRKFVEERTQTEAARLLGVNQATVSRNLEPTRQPSFRILIRLAQVTHRTIDDVIGLTKAAPQAEVHLRDSELMRVAKAVADQVVRKLPSDRPPPPSSRRKKGRSKK